MPIARSGVGRQYPPCQLSADFPVMPAKPKNPQTPTESGAKKKKQRGRITKGGNEGRVIGWRERRNGSTLSTRAKRVALGPEQIAKLSDESLLDTRLCDLGVSVDSPWLKPKLDKLYSELRARGIRFRPHAWLSDEWFSPDGIPGIAIPFCLAHPRLKSLERRQMYEVEGGTAQWCMKILRHEAGHALDTAFRLHRKAAYKKSFGNYFDPYPASYRPNPNSKKYVMHLEPWYSQSHPAEDFAETFAVWLRPRSRWRHEYEGWGAYKKLELVESFMECIAQQSPKVRSRAKADPITRNRKTLRQLYAERHQQYAKRRPLSFDHDLKRLFPAKLNGRQHGSTSAAVFLHQNRSELSRVVSQWTGEYRYNVNQVLREMIDRCRELDLRTSAPAIDVKQRALVMLTVQTMNYLHGGHHRVAL